MKKFPLMEKLREFRCSLSRKKAAPPRPRPPTRLNATARRMSPAEMDEYDDDQPTTKLSSAFIVVLILHIVAVGGVFAFKGIKAHRLSRELPVATASERTAAARLAASEHAASATSTATPAVPAATPNTPTQRVYIAHGGETLAKVASVQGVSVAELAQYNALNTSAVLRPNQRVVIPPAKTARAAAPATAGATPKATVTNVASARIVTPAVPRATAAPSTNDVKKVNFLSTVKDGGDSATAFAATTPKPGATAAGTKPTLKTYTVAQKDTVTSIARKYGVSTDELMKLNKISDPKKLQLNQQLKIPTKSSE